MIFKFHKISAIALILCHPNFLLANTYSDRLLGRLLCNESLTAYTESINANYFAKWGERAFQAYREESVEIAIWALTNYADILINENNISEESHWQRSRKTELILVYGRLAFSFKKLGLEKKYDENISKSLQLARQLFENMKMNSLK